MAVCVCTGDESCISIAQAVEKVLGYQPNIVDINMAGCPVPKVVNGGAGALMKDPKKRLKCKSGCGGFQCAGDGKNSERLGRQKRKRG